ncbi:MAG: hypothetical protein DRI90_12415 [Deltaproteobacteria bacterium]|nr:MAG: hypothetical protein DRI90_12415 [Deltaproteobacteria bacterium]
MQPIRSLSAVTSSMALLAGCGTADLPIDFGESGQGGGETPSLQRAPQGETVPDLGLDLTCKSAADCPGPDTDCAYRVCEDGICDIRLPQVATPCGGGNQVCNGSGVCLGVPGAKCGSAKDCLIPNCANSVCCDSPCVGGCNRCDQADAPGVCSPAKIGSNPDGTCGVGICDGAGSCLTGDYLWSKGFAAPGVQRISVAAVDGNGHILVAGSFTESIDLGGGALDCAGGSDGFVAKLDANGNHMWSMRFGTWGYQEVTDLAVDSDDSLVVTGFFTGTVQFGAADGAGTLTSQGSDDVFVARIAADGTPKWSRALGDAGIEQATSVAVEPSGNVAVAGVAIHLLPAGSPNEMGEKSDKDSAQVESFVATFSASGTPLWTRRVYGPDHQLVESIAYDSLGNLLVAGQFQTQLHLGDALLDGADLDFDGFLAKLGPLGEVMFLERFGAEGDETVAALAVDSQDNIVVTGAFAGSFEIGGSSIMSQGLTDVFVAKIDAAGVLSWLHGYGDTAHQRARDIAITPLDHVVVVGDFLGAINLGGAPLDAVDGSKAFVLKLRGDGHHAWSTSLGGSGSQIGATVAATPDGGVVLAGAFSGTAIAGNETLVNEGALDAFAIALTR